MMNIRQAVQPISLLLISKLQCIVLLLFVRERSAALTSITAKSGNLTLDVPSWAFSFAAEGSFGVSAALYIPSNEERALCKIAGAIEGKVLLIHQTDGCNIVIWTDQAEERNSVGAIYYVDLNRYQASQFAWVYWEREVPFTTLPVVSAMVGDESAWMISQGDSVVVTLNKGEENPYQDLIYSSMYKGIMIAVSSHCGYNVYRSGFISYALFFIGRQFKVTRMIVLGTELVSNSIRLIWFLNSALGRQQALPYSVYRFTASAHMAWSFASTAAVCMELWKIYKEKLEFGSSAKLVTAALGTGLILDTYLTWYSSAIKELPSATFLAAFYGLIQLPLGICFVRLGGRVSARLLDGAKHMDATSDEVKIRKSFARLVRSSGWAMFSNVVILLMNPMMYSISKEAIQYGYCAMIWTAVVVSTLQINAIRIPAFIQLKMGLISSAPSAVDVGSSNKTGALPSHQQTRDLPAHHAIQTGITNVSSKATTGGNTFDSRRGSRSRETPARHGIASTVLVVQLHKPPVEGTELMDASTVP